VSAQLHVPAALPLGKEPRYPLNRRLGGPRNRSGRLREGASLLPLPGIEHGSPDGPARGLVCLPTEMCQRPGRAVQGPVAGLL
jgi:hypothetical protein